MSIESEDRARLVLSLPMQQPNDANATTIRDYLIALLRDVWQYDEGFDGKRPFGNSGWTWDLYKPLIVAGLAEGTFDEDGEIDAFDSDQDDKAHDLIADAIEILR